MARNGICQTREIIMKQKYLYLLALIFISGCSENIDIEYDIEFPKQKTYDWRLVTAWPKNYPGLGMAPERIADLVEEMSLSLIHI